MLTPSLAFTFLTKTIDRQECLSVILRDRKLCVQLLNEFHIQDSKESRIILDKYFDDVLFLEDLSDKALSEEEWSWIFEKMKHSHTNILKYYNARKKLSDHERDTLFNLLKSSKTDCANIVSGYNVNTVIFSILTKEQSNQLFKIGLSNTFHGIAYLKKTLNAPQEHRQLVYQQCLKTGSGSLDFISQCKPSKGELIELIKKITETKSYFAQLLDKFNHLLHYKIKIHIAHYIVQQQNIDAATIMYKHTYGDDEIEKILAPLYVMGKLSNEK